ncbi:MAG: hypothetical protein ACO307_18145, partial [Ilumatobacteraceae bacterium]
MANAVYPKGKKAILDGDVDFLTDTIKIVLVDATYTYSTAHDFLDDIAAGDRVATSAALSSKTTTDGAFDAADVTFTSLSGNTVTSWVLFKDTGSAATSQLIAYFDTVSGGGALSFTPNGGNFTLSFGASG